MRYIVFTSDNDGATYTLSTVEGPSLDLAYRQIKLEDGHQYYLVAIDKVNFIRHEEKKSDG